MDDLVKCNRCKKVDKRYRMLADRYGQHVHKRCYAAEQNRPDDDRVAQALGYPDIPDDTPSLGEPWWHNR